MTEKEKMIAGKLYNALDEQLVKERITARELMRAFNNSGEEESDKRRELLAKLIPNGGEAVEIQPPFHCDYGTNIYLGNSVFMNFNCIILDVVKVSIGSRTLLGPAVQIYTATHPLDHQERASGLESGKPIIIGEDVWVGGNATICPGVTIGERSVIGAGSVVTRNIPPDVFAAGNPCKVVREFKK